MLKAKAAVGGNFVIEDSSIEEVFTPEDFTDEHQMMADMTEKFVENDVWPVLDKIEEQQFDQSVALLKKVGELGLLGLDIPEQYGGMELDKISSTIIMEKMALSRSFAITFGGQVGIGSLPIVYFGTEQQKEKYLPSIVSAEKIGAYALTEPTSGTDALGAKTVAKLSDCENFYVLNGEKQWITNSAFADIFIVFAKVDGEKFTAFIVEKEYEGVSTGPEEKKMGLKGSSTRSLILDDVKVPVGNVLGEIGKGHHIAFNILNIGRHKISAQSLGTSKRAIELSVKYAKERKQFGQSLSDFNLIRNKIADMGILTYVNESMVYRTAGLMDRGFEDKDKEGFDPAKAIREYAVECSINKVFSTEKYDSIIDEAVQIHGGYGYMSEYEVETLYRDSRINRIFEGTNEINRMVISSTLLKKLQLESEEEKISELASGNDDLLAKEKNDLIKLKVLFNKVARIVQKSGLDKNEEQEVLAFLSDLAIEIYAIDSAIVRTEKAVAQNGSEKEAFKIDCTIAYVQEAAPQIVMKSLQILPYLGDEQLLDHARQNLSTMYEQPLVDMVILKRNIAEKLITQEKYSS